MASRIVLVRHGPSACRHARGMLNRDGMLKWREAYDGAGIAHCRPPASLTHIASEAAHIIASDLPRAVQSAQSLAQTRSVTASELLRETPLPVPHWPTPLPYRAWDALIHLCWGYRILCGTDVTDADLARAKAAAAWVAGLARESTALVVTHGVFRRLVARQLLAAGWSAGERHGGYASWSSWSFYGTPRPKVAR